MYQQNSTEAYFGRNNPLVEELTSNISIMRKTIFAETETNPYIKNSELVKKLKNITDAISSTITSNFNIERCNIGWTSVGNFYSIGMMFNSDMYKSADAYSKLRTSINDIAETSNGYRFKNKKGVYFNIIMSMKILKDTLYSDVEIVALMLHEIGHCINAIVDGLDIYVLNNYLETLTKNGFGLSKSKNIEMINKIKGSIGDEQLEDKMAKYLLENTSLDKNTYKSFQSLNGDKLTEIAAGFGPLDSPSKITYVKKPNILKIVFDKIVSAIYTIFILPFFLPMLKKQSKKISGLNIETSCKYKEETVADNVANAYGVSAELETALKKITTIIPYSASNNIENNRAMNMIDQFAELEKDYITAVCGYPSNPKRVANNYAACKFELDNNKDLTGDQRKEILDTMNKLKSIYTEYENEASSKGLLYRTFQAICKSSIEEESEKDPQFKKHVLEPLKARSDKYYKK